MTKSRLLAVVGLLGALVIGVVALPLAFGRPGAEPSVSAAPQATAAASSPIPSITPGQALTGWPVTWEDPYSDTPQVGPDGMIHLGGSQFDASGRQPISWLPLPSSPDCIPLAPGDPQSPCWIGDFALSKYHLADGTEYYLWLGDKGQGSLEVVDQSGRAVQAGAWDGLAVGLDGTAVAWRREIAGLDTAPRIVSTTLSVIGADGKAPAGWPVTYKGAASEPVVGSDGTIYLTLTASGERAPRIVALGAGARPVAGWPFILPSGSQPRLDGTGGPGTPFYPVPPFLGRDGSIFAVATSDGTSYARGSEAIFSLDRDGRLRSGWPAILPGSIGLMGKTDPCFDWCGPTFQKPLVPPIGAGPVELYVHAGDKLLALDGQGGIPPGWPKEIARPEVDEPPFFDWLWWDLLPDGDLAAVEFLAPDNAPTECRLWRWNPDGSLSS